MKNILMRENNYQNLLTYAINKAAKYSKFLSTRNAATATLLDVGYKHKLFKSNSSRTILFEFNCEFPELDPNDKFNARVLGVPFKLIINDSIKQLSDFACSEAFVIAIAKSFYAYVACVLINSNEFIKFLKDNPKYNAINECIDLVRSPNLPSNISEQIMLKNFMVSAHKLYYKANSINYNNSFLKYIDSLSEIIISFDNPIDERDCELDNNIIDLIEDALIEFSKSISLELI